MTSQGWAGRQLCSSVPPWPGEVFIVGILHGEFVFGLHELFGKEVHVEVCMVHLSLTGAVAVADAHGAGGRGPGVAMVPAVVSMDTLKPTSMFWTPVL